ncbi:MAG: hypothetical protein HQL70_03145 [Magnetococcales bacterium]|nr:hypothetical protein [Magnetococcales bacterium]
MNMLPGKLIHSPKSRRSWLLAILLFTLLGGCSDSSYPDLDPKIFADDSKWQTFKRHIAPESYWIDKVQRMSSKVEVTREHFLVESKRYRELLEGRRKQVLHAVTKAKERKESEKKARQDVIEAFRGKLDPLRAATRELGKKLRIDMATLEQARQELFKVK